MIKKIVVTNPKGQALDLELTNPDKSGLGVVRVEGLGPPKANINGQEMASSDGMFYASARADSRTIIFTLEMRSRDRNSPYGYLSIEESRHLTYVYFPLKKEITITVYTDSQVLYTKGYVESNEPDIFVKHESTIITVICPDPYMYEHGNSRTVFSGVQPMLEFPFYNDSLTNPLLEMGQIWIDTTAFLYYNGTVDTGVLITIHALGSCSNITLFNLDTDEHMAIDTYKIEQITGSAFRAKDDIIISTVKGDRYCKLLRDGVYTNIIGALGRDTDWFQISNGNNAFGFSAESGESNISVTFSYRNAYVGV